MLTFFPKSGLVVLSGEHLLYMQEFQKILFYSVLYLVLGFTCGQQA